MDPVLLAVAVVVLVVTVTALFYGRAARSRAVTMQDHVSSPLRSKLAATAGAIRSGLTAALGSGALGSEAWEEVEETLIAADIGVQASADIVEAAKSMSPANADEAVESVRRSMLSLFETGTRMLDLDGDPAVVLVVGVNGVGKTTSIAKLAARLIEDGKTVMVGAADTFRAAAGEQLDVWAAALKVDVVRGQAGADPAAVAFDALQASRSRDCNVLIVDTAGRLQAKVNLMSELEKIRRVLEREAGIVDEVLLVIDASTGQNALAQARQFTEAVGVTGVILTKLDGTARGGIVLAIERELGIKVKLIGIGESVGDLIPFDPEEFVDALVEEQT